jgi:hypothetical protein
LKSKVDALASDLELSEGKYSDIDMIFEKRAREKKNQAKEALNEDQLESLFGSLREEEEKKK